MRIDRRRAPKRGDAQPPGPPDDWSSLPSLRKGLRRFVPLTQCHPRARALGSLFSPRKERTSRPSYDAWQSALLYATGHVSQANRLKLWRRSVNQCPAKAWARQGPLVAEVSAAQLIDQAGALLSPPQFYSGNIGVAQAVGFPEPSLVVVPKPIDPRCVCVHN